MTTNLNNVKIYTSPTKFIFTSPEGDINPKDIRKKYEEDGHNVYRVEIRTITVKK